MARSLGPVLMAGGVTMVNQSVFHGQPIDWRVPIGVALTAATLALAEKGFPDAAVGLGYLILITTLFVRIDPKTPTPVESALSWWQAGPGK